MFFLEKKIRRALGLALAFCLAMSASFPAAADTAKNNLITAGSSLDAGPGASAELRGVWISYLDWLKFPSDEAGFEKAVDQVLDRCVELNMNAVFVHVRADADAMYPSDYFPWSRFITGTQGLDPGYDPLDYFVEAAHDRDLQFHAWINPLRVTGYRNRWDYVSEDNPAKIWLTDSSTHNDRWVLKQGGEYYFNPAVPEVRELIVSGVREVVDMYDIDGVHFDDYFYPEVDDSSRDKWFDKPEYDRSGSSLSIADWRRENINTLIQAVYEAVHESREEAVFGISPEGYIDNLRSDTRLFTDVDTWMTQPGYVDYIMPQLYWGFEHRLADGSLAPYAFENNLRTWVGLRQEGGERVTLYLGLAMYKAGSGTKDNNAVPEWLRRSDIIKRQVEAGRKSGAVAGYCFYSYSSFQDADCQEEVENLMKVLK
ncbi:MAG: family 10 glycosylhydrolase [Clostridiales bacterium]|nr:family 10 glycosylhydrolase [Clostridiales bacterium]